MKKTFFLVLLLGIVSGQAFAQDSGGQDSTGLPGQELRPRRDTYIIETFPSPALHGQTIKIQFYNHNPQILSLRVYDMNDKLVKELQPPEGLANGIHSYDFNTALYATGTYFIRLTNYSPSGSDTSSANAVNTTESRFIVVH